ncbi:MAG: hypothetical protein ABI947_19910 [Chloroflexota bacterium]
MERLEKILAEGGYEAVDVQTTIEQTFDVHFEISLRSRDQKGFIVALTR